MMSKTDLITVAKSLLSPFIGDYQRAQFKYQSKNHSHSLVIDCLSHDLALGLIKTLSDQNAKLEYVDPFNNSTIHLRLKFDRPPAERRFGYIQSFTYNAALKVLTPIMGGQSFGIHPRKDSGVIEFGCSRGGVTRYFPLLKISKEDDNGKVHFVPFMRDPNLPEVITEDIIKDIMKEALKAEDFYIAD